MCSQWARPSQDIRIADALDINRDKKDVDANSSGFQKSFNVTDCVAALAATNQYQCGANLFVAGLNSGPTKGALHRFRYCAHHWDLYRKSSIFAR